MERRATSYHSQGLARALTLLRLLGTSDRPLGLAEMSSRLSLPKSTVLRLLSVLEEEEFVYREGSPPVYSVGHAVLEISEVFRRNVNTADVAAPYLRRLAERTGQTANIGVLQGPWVLHLCVEEPERPLRFRSESGSLDHTYCTGLGKMLLAVLPSERRGEHLPSEQPYARFTENTIVTPAALDDELDLVRERGYSLDAEERDLGVVCLAVRIPVDGELNVALSISGPAGELTESERATFLPILREIADGLAADRRFVMSLHAGRVPGPAGGAE